MIPRPPAINNYEVKHSTTLRFTTSAAVNQFITFANLLDTILVGTTATAAFDLFFAVKIRRIKVWALPILGSSSSVSVVFSGTTAGFVGDRIVHQDSSMGIEPAFLNVSPKKDTLASMFQISSANINAFFIDAPINSVIDLDLSFRSDLLGLAVAAAQATVGGVAGAIAFRGMDGLAKAASNFVVPTGFNSV
jgi:hypothetical protein